MSNVHTTIVTDKTTPGYWHITLDNPPINAIDDRMYDEFHDQQLENPHAESRPAPVGFLPWV